MPYIHNLPNKHTGTLGSLASFGINFNASALQVPVSVYVVFIILMSSGFFVACFTIVPPSRVRRPDGKPLAHYPHEGFWYELKAQSKLFRDWRLLALFIPLFGSEIVVIVFSTLNCECRPPVLILNEDSIFMLSRSPLFQHTDTVSEFGVFQLDANFRFHLDRYSAGQQKNRKSTNSRLRIPRCGECHCYRRLDWHHGMAVQ